MIDKKHELWLDSAKGFALILVVAGHAYNHNNLITYIYWFHMPAFFLFSGYVSKPVKQWSQVGPYLKKRAHSLLIPYITYLGLFTMIRYAEELMQGNSSFHWYIEDIGKVLFGGRFISSYYGVFWFITCLFFTQVLFLIIFLIFKRTHTRLLFIAFLYIISHIEGRYISTLDGLEPSLHVWIPWNIDVSMLALGYYSIGYYVKPYLKQIPPVLTGLCTLLIMGLITIQELNLLDYHLSMKYVSYNHYSLDIVIPLIMTIAYCGIFQLIKSKKVLSLCSFMNNKSMAIMYMHIGVNKILLEFIDYGNIIYTIVGVTVPLFIAIFILEKKDTVRHFFLGIQRRSELKSSKKMKME
ncbi:acyltransferase family protein [Bacillus cytotoxicus]|uniref:acyltransferase family protein n=1 Tax=Bacillus cytotoxicus TaxID=580165 RepID=UPI000863C907|nr:acyltransferase family protein [Bacillus cytotoxicus]AWC29048.1 acyltransferase [Bacillus cytotoxicus]AWC39566.1 acyltransferase [Bacillus cytotoxicus]AWC47497.1 acyltransferase [Bacillus cytotoxicus]AWC53119.1 acyltransferase [Bacillus cytotoxicus]AWC57248.1 acyltransferase [Bacillus cytotoxicus]